MGVGRFAFTPLLPLMVRDGTVTGTLGAWLAAANYLGYLMGALLAARLTLEPARLLTVSLLAIAALTVAMGVATSAALWLALRWAAGVASAWALVATSGWALAQLARAGRANWAGWIYAGVGTGIAITGVFCGWLAWPGASAQSLWRGLGLGAAALGLLALAMVWKLPAAASTAPVASSGSATASVARAPWGLIACYGVLGFGYILPATFLPLLARQMLGDSPHFAWAWPVFGAAAALSTLLAATWVQRFGRLRLWSLAHAAMALGVVLPMWWPGLSAVVLSALLVGGTFMVVTMLGLQEVREQALRHGLAPTPLLARMTAAFAAGQLAGPVLSALLGPADAGSVGLRWSLHIAAAALLASAVYLHRQQEHRA